MSIDDLHAGLSARESEVLALLCEGRSNHEIAAGLYVNVETVRSHLKSVYRKLGVHTRTQALATSRILNRAGRRRAQRASWRAELVAARRDTVAAGRPAPESAS